MRVGPDRLSRVDSGEEWAKVQHFLLLAAVLLSIVAALATASAMLSLLFRLMSKLRQRV